MTVMHRRRNVLRAGLALGTTLCLPQARACEFFATHLRINHPWTRASADGQNTAIVSMRFDDVTRTDRLIGVETPVAAAAELGGLGARPAVDFLIPQGQESALHEFGTFVRLVGLQHRLEVARSYPLKLVFEHSGTVNATLTVDFAGPRCS